MSKPAKITLALVSCSTFRVTASATKKLKATTIKQVSAVARLEAQTAAGAIIAGLNLHRVKASAAHGEFGKFIQMELAKAMEWTGGTATTNASYYMRLSGQFVEKAGLKQSDIIAALDGNKAANKILHAALEKFIDGNSLTELLIKFRIKGVNLHKELTSGETENEDGGLTDDQKFTQAREQAWEETWNSVQRIRASLTEPEQLQLLSDPAQLEKLKAELIEANKLTDERLDALRKAKA